jgi:hypothetical protein
VDTLTVAILVVTLLALVAPIVEIAVKRPRTFLEMTTDARAFAEAPLHESAAMRSPADVREVEDAPVDDDRLAGADQWTELVLPSFTMKSPERDRSLGR